MASLFALFASFVGVTAARAQDSYSSRGTTTADLLLDARARVADSERANDELHGGYLTAHSDSLLGPHRSLNLEAIYQYHAFRYQRASVGTEFTVRTRKSATADDEAANDGGLPIQLEVGIVRIPFGIYNYEETYASGLISYPIPRLDYAYHSVDWGVTGVRLNASDGPVQIESAFFDGSGQGTWGNFNHVDGAVVRAQTYLPPALVLGASFWDGHEAVMPGAHPVSPVTLGGLDLRYMKSYLVLRGEALAGTLAGDTYRGGYLDTYYRLPGVEAVTLVGRVEALKPATTQPTSRQLTLGARWTITPRWTLSGNWLHNNIAKAYTFTWTAPTRHSGALLFQLMHRIPLH